MRKKLIVVIILLTAIFLTSCNIKSQDNGRIKSAVTDIMESTLSKKEQSKKDETQIMKEKNLELENKLNEYKNEIAQLKDKLNNYELNYELVWRNKLNGDYPWIEIFNVNQRWEQIIIYKKDKPDEKIIVDNPKTIESIATTFYIVRDSTGEHPNGVQTSDDTYVYEAVAGNDKLVFYVWNDETIEFTNLPMRFFQTGRGINQLGKAYLPKPKISIENKVLLKMINSGLMSGEKEYPYYFTQPFRIKQLPYGFNNVTKKEIKKSDVPKKQITERLTFYYYSEKIYMAFYSNYIQILDGNEEYWYQINKKDLLSLLHSLSAA